MTKTGHGRSYKVSGESDRVTEGRDFANVRLLLLDFVFRFRFLLLDFGSSDSCLDLVIMS
ncbi:hypothetical protein Hanom_Chr17g01561421 [Helianthus anomalus]